MTIHRPVVVRTLALGLLLGVAFLAGARWTPRAVAQGTSTSAPAGGRGGGGGTADGDRTMVAVTGTSSTGAAVLYLVDTHRKRLCVYQSNGKNIELVAARNLEYDFKIEAYRDTSDEEVQVPTLRAKWQRAQGAGPDGGARPDGGK
jgi:hypothetical protein